MGKDIKKFVNLKFLKTIDLGLMRELIERHATETDGFDLTALDGDAAVARSKLTEYFKGPAGNWPEGLVADLHRISELGDADGLQLILQQAQRANVSLFAATGPDDDDPLPQSHEPKHVALRVYLRHPAVFEAAADFRALQAPPALAEFAGPERGIGADLTDAKIEAFRARIAEIFRADLQGDYCRLGPYEDGDEINMVISHGATVSTMPVVDGGAERVISLRAVKYAVLRYSETTGVLKLGGVPKARQAEIAELFAMTILERGGFFAGDDAQDLYTLEPVTRAGSGFTFDYAFNPNILQVLLTEAAADLYGEDEKGAWRLQRSLRSKDASGAALAHFAHTPVRFGRNWRLGEIVFRVFFKGEGKRPSQVTVRLKPRGTVAFRRTRYERQIMTLLERNELVIDRDDLRLIDAAE